MLNKVNKMAPCDKCGEKLPPENDFVLCALCKSKLHYKCAEIREAKWRIMPSETRSNWRCENCRSKSVSDNQELQIPTLSQPQISNQMLETLSSVIRNIIKEENASLVSKINEFQKSIEYYSDQIDKISNLMKNVAEENKSIKKECSDLQQKYKKLEQEYSEIKLSVEDDKLYARNRNILIEGLQETEGENVVDITLKIANCIGINNINKSDIQMAHRLNTKTTKKPIVVQFSHRMVRDEYLQKAKSRRITSTTIHPNLASSPLYINEHLTPYYKALFYEAKNKRRNEQKIYKYVWVKNSKLFVRKTDNSPIIRIRSVSDL